MKIIFLDIDGVLNNIGQVVSEDCNCPIMDEQGFDRTAVKLLDWLCYVTGSKVVISSTWRTVRSVEWFQNVFTNIYKTSHIDIIGCTPHLPNKIRGDEVQRYCNEYFNSSDDVFVILDDDRDFNTDQLVSLILVDNVVGLTLYDVFDAATVLGVDNYHTVAFEDLRQIVEFKRKPK